MNTSNDILTLTRDVIGVLIPQGTRVELPEGATAQMTQALGGSFTIQVEGHLFRIPGQDADALGMEVPDGPEVPENATDKEIEAAVWKFSTRSSSSCATEEGEVGRYEQTSSRPDIGAGCVAPGGHVVVSCAVAASTSRATLRYRALLVRGVWRSTRRWHRCRRRLRS